MAFISVGDSGWAEVPSQYHIIQTLRQRRWRSDLERFFPMWTSQLSSPRRGSQAMTFARPKTVLGNVKAEGHAIHPSKKQHGGLILGGVP